MKNNKNVLKGIKVEDIEVAVSRCWQWFFNYPKSKIGLNDLSSSIGSSKTSTKKAVEYLMSIRFLQREIIGKAWLLQANQEHPFFKTKKIPINLSLIYESGILDAVYKAVPGARAVILFGSYRWGVDIEESDIDIAVEIVGNQELQIHRLGIIEQLGYRKNVPVNVHIFSRNKIDLNLFANIANGIALDGFLEVRP
ncbi:MAG: hypothetical protein RL557_629 [archaeon]|jgi:predicted nucleotidyltransferase